MPLRHAPSPAIRRLNNRVLSNPFFSIACKHHANPERCPSLPISGEHIYSSGRPHRAVALKPVRMSFGILTVPQVTKTGLPAVARFFDERQISSAVSAVLRGENFRASVLLVRSSADTALEIWRQSRSTATGKRVFDIPTPGNACASHPVAYSVDVALLVRSEAGNCMLLKNPSLSLDKAARTLASKSIGGQIDVLHFIGVRNDQPRVGNLELPFCNQLLERVTRQNSATPSPFSSKE